MSGMATKVQSKTSLFPGYCSMRDLDEDPISYSPSLFYGDKLLMNGQYYHGHSPSATADASSGYEKDVVKQTMLEHEAIIKYQVHKLHGLYRVQRNLMEEIRRKELHRKQYAEGTSFSPTSQITVDDRQKWHVPSFPMEKFFHARPSVSGVEYAHLPFVAVEEHSEPADLLTLQNGGNLRHIEVLESRPTKVRRKYFDLQLPADEYIRSDESDKPGDEKMYGSLAHIAEGNCKIGSQSSLKFLPRGGDNGRCQEDTSRFEQSLRNNGLADLNEPLHSEEWHVIDNIDSVGQSAFLGVNDSSGPSGKPNSQFLDLSEQSLFNAYGRNGNEYQNNQSSWKNWKIGWSAHIHEAGNGEDDLQSVSRGSHPEKFSSLLQTIHKFHNEVDDPSPVSFSSQSKVDFSTERGTEHDLGSSNGGNEAFENKHLNSIASLHKPSTLPVIPSSSVAIPWSHSASSLQISSSSCNQKSVSAQIYPCLSITAASTEPNYSNGLRAEGWPSNSNPKSNLAFGFEYPSRNGSYHGSSSGSKEVAVNLSTVSFDYLNSSDFKGVPEHGSNLELVKYSKPSNSNEMRPAKYLDRDKKHEEPLAALPWLRTGASCYNGVRQVGVSSPVELNHFQSFSISKKADSKCFLSGTAMHKETSMSRSSEFDGWKTETEDCSRNKKILGFPIFERAYTSNNVSSTLTSSLSAQNPSENEVVENRWEISMLDINLPCDLAVSDLGNQAVRDTSVKDMDLCNKDSKFRCQIDLNLSIIEEEASTEPTPSNKMRMRAVIDLETLPVPDTDVDVGLEEEDVETPTVSLKSSQLDAKQPQDELMKKAAEAIVAISSPLCCNNLGDHANANSQSETSVKEPLTWFVDTVTSFVDNMEIVLDTSFGGKHDESNGKSSIEEIDIFESMTLKQMETKEEDYMPRPLVLESINLEESGASSFTTRPRRGRARRGRQRRDFQNDILPGIVSLARHEVTEDLQTFGGIMRVTGYSWNLGLTRRNSTRGCGRGRR